MPATRWPYLYRPGGRRGIAARPETEQPRQGSGPRTEPRFNIRQLTDVLHCKLQQHFQRKDTEHIS
jgi:hypothetical protein